MAKSPAKGRLAPVEVEKIIPAPAFILTLEERNVLRGIFQSEAFRKAWHNARLSKPPTLISRDLNGEDGSRIALNQLKQIQGWELCEAALLKQLNDPAPVRTKVEENFPDSGLQIVNPKDLAPPPKPPPAPLYTEPKKKG